MSEFARAIGINVGRFSLTLNKGVVRGWLKRTINTVTNATTATVSLYVCVFDT